jgi:adenylosuccinate lyase
MACYALALQQGSTLIARFVHQGMTSSDVLDTCLTGAADILIADLDKLLARHTDSQASAVV